MEHVPVRQQMYGLPGLIGTVPCIDDLSLVVHKVRASIVFGGKQGIAFIGFGGIQNHADLAFYEAKITILGRLALPFGNDAVA